MPSKSWTQRLQIRMINSLGLLPVPESEPLILPLALQRLFICILDVLGCSQSSSFPLLRYKTTFHCPEYNGSITKAYPSIWILDTDSLHALKSWAGHNLKCVLSGFAKWSLAWPPGPFTCIYGYQITHATVGLLVTLRIASSKNRNLKSTEI